MGHSEDIQRLIQGLRELEDRVWELENERRNQLDDVVGFQIDDAPEEEFDNEETEYIGHNVKVKLKPDYTYRTDIDEDVQGRIEELKRG